MFELVQMVWPVMVQGLVWIGVVMAALYGYMVWYESRVVGRIKVVGVAKHVEEEALEDVQHGLKKLTYAPPQPVPVDQLIHYNSLITLYINIFKTRNNSVTMHEYAFKKNQFRPIISFVFDKPFVAFATPSAARVIFTKWKEVEKDNALMFTPDMKKFFASNIVFANGDDWKCQRSIMNPAFFRIDRFTDVFVENAKRVVNTLSDYQGLEISPNEFMSRMALDILGLAVFGIDFNYLSQLDKNYQPNPTGERNQKALDAYNHVMNTMGLPARVFGGELYAKLPLEENRKMNEAIDSFNAFILDLIKDCRAHKTKPNTLLQMLVDSLDEGGQGMTDEQLRGNLNILFLAGHETTASALSSLFYYLAKYQNIQEKLVKEINDTFSQGENISNYDKLHGMTYLECVLNENLRLSPPVGQLPIRLNTCSQVIDGYKIPKDFLIMLSIYSVHRNTDAWGQDADEFRPERFLEARHPSFSLIPFGGSSRQCIGKQFSLIEQKSLVVSLLQNFKISFASSGVIPELEFQKDLPNLIPTNDIKYKLERR